MSIASNYLFLAAACSLGVNRGDNCKVEDSDAGYVFDLSPLAKHTWDNGNDFYSLVNRSQYTFELKVGLFLRTLTTSQLN